MSEDNTYILRSNRPKLNVKSKGLGLTIYESVYFNPSDDTALIDAETNDSLSYKDVLGLSCSLAESLRRIGVEKNTKIAICSENSIYYPIALVSAFYLNAIVVPINQNYTPFEIGHALNLTKPQLLFCSKKFIEHNLGIEKKYTFLENVILLESEKNAIDGYESFEMFINTNLFAAKLIYNFNIESVDIVSQTALIMHSSGTTGLPKGVQLSHLNVLAIYHEFLNRQFIPYHRNIIGLLPFFHSYGLVTLMLSFLKKTTTIVLRKFDEKQFLEVIQNYKITSLNLVPPLMNFLVKHPLVDKYDLSHVDTINCGAAPLSKDIVKAFLKKFPKLTHVNQGYGLTESTLSLILTSDDPPYVNDSVGKLAAEVMCKVVDTETGRSLPANKVGELYFKGPMIMQGYYNNEEATRNTFTKDGWFKTGDVGYYDENENFFIVDRLKELIKYKGFQVAPAELESILLTNPKIKDVGVVGVKREDEGEVPLAFVVKQVNSQDLTEKEVENYIAERLSNYKRLRGGVRFLDEIPRNPSGKILRRELRELSKKINSKL